MFCSMRCRHSDNAAAEINCLNIFSLLTFWKLITAIYFNVSQVNKIPQYSHLDEVMDINSSGSYVSILISASFWKQGAVARCAGNEELDSGQQPESSRSQTQTCSSYLIWPTRLRLRSRIGGDRKIVSRTSWLSFTTAHKFAIYFSQDSARPRREREQRLFFSPTTDKAGYCGHTWACSDHFLLQESF